MSLYSGGIFKGEGIKKICVGGGWSKSASSNKVWGPGWSQAAECEAGREAGRAPSGVVVEASGSRTKRQAGEGEKTRRKIEWKKRKGKKKKKKVGMLTALYRFESLEWIGT